MTGDLQATFTQYKSFPGDWRLDLSDLQNISQLKSLLEFAKTPLKEQGALQILFIYPPQGRQVYHELIKENISDLGFEIYFIKQNSRLDLNGFSIPKKSVPGIRILRWVDEHDKEDLDKLEPIYLVEFESDYKVRAQNRWDKDNPDFGEFKRRFITGEADLDSLHVAYSKAKPVGLTYVWLDDECGIFYTGVLPEYTNRGIATSLKIEMAYHLKTRGVPNLTTSNRLTNIAILRTNDKLGFEVVNEEIYYYFPL